MVARITVVLLNYRRPENLKHVIDSIHRQTVHPDIVLWNNGGAFNDSRICWQVDSSLNQMCWPRWFMAALTRSEYVCSLDDDLAFADEQVLEHALDFAETKARDRIVGAYGVRLMARRSYMKSEHIDLPQHDVNVDIVKGRMMLFRRELLQQVPFPAADTRSETLRNDDIAVSGLIARGKTGFHRVPGLFHNRLVELSPKECGLVRQPEHWESRNRTKEEFFGSNGVKLWVRLCADRIERAKKISVKDVKPASRRGSQQRLNKVVKAGG